MSSATEDFAAYLSRKAGTLSDRQERRAETCLRDYLAVAAAGARKNRARWQPLLELLPPGNAELVGWTERTAPATAALVNGFNAHSLELDDGQRFAMIHLGAAVISAIRAASAVRGIGHDALLRGIVMGYEAACRLSIAMQPAHKQRGYHAAGTCGTVGAAAGVAFALGMDGPQLARVLSAAAGSAAGMLEIQEQDSELKPYNLGRAAMDGLAAAFMGWTGFAPPQDMLGGERGFFALLAGQWDRDKLLAERPDFEIDRVYLKPYASCRHSHSAVEAALRLHGRVAGRPIRDVTVETYRLGVKGHDHREIRGTASAKLSTPYAVAVALLRGRAGLAQFEPLDPEAVALARRVEVAENPALTAECPGKRMATVRVRLGDGTELEARVEHAKGEPENPMDDGELSEKWNELAAFPGGCPGGRPADGGGSAQA